MDRTFMTLESQNRFLGLFIERESISVSLLRPLLTAAQHWENVAGVSQEGRRVCPSSNYLRPCPEHLQEEPVCWGLQGRREVLKRRSRDFCCIVGESAWPSRRQGTVCAAFGVGKLHLHSCLFGF